MRSPRKAALPGRVVRLSLLGAALLSACGTTVPTAARTANSDAQLVPGGSNEVAPTQSSVGQPSGDGGTGPSSTGSTGSAQTPVPTGDGSGVTMATGLHLGPGVDATTIRVGFTIQDNNATVSSLASAYNVQLANNRGAYEALVRYVNTHGGIGGRRLSPDYYTYDPTSGTADQIGQAACAAFTEDDKVFAAIDPVNGSGSFNTCMQQRGRVMMQYGLYFGSSKAWAKYPNVVAADGLPLDDGGRILAEHLAASGFLSKSTRLGAIVRSSDDLTQAYSHGFVPALAKYGLRVEQTQYIRDAQASSDISGYTADISSAVLKFSTTGIDRVVFFDTGSYAATVFTQTAEKQQYRPKYGFSSLNSIVGLQGSSSTAPQQQMVGAQGVSWETNADGLTKTRTPSAQQCLAILKEAGIVPSDAGTEGNYLKTCQTFFLFKTAAELAGPDLNRDSFLSAVERLGSTFRSTNTWDGLTHFGPGDHSGVSVFRPFVYREACSCFAVSGGNQQVGAA